MIGRRKSGEKFVVGWGTHTGLVAFLCKFLGFLRLEIHLLLEETLTLLQSFVGGLVVLDGRRRF